MALAPGTRLGPYEILSAIGAGGMGEVYRARDTKLGRDVALKVLPESFAADPERVARMHREAQVLAALNHSNIAAIHGFEDSGDVHALVLEFVDGETLAERIERGPIPLDEALPIAKQTAEALEAAHEQGIIHRDLKPANIKVRPDGTVKVLDFGLAKLAEAPPTAAAAHAQSPLSMSPTITSPAMTGVGVLLGTAAYMSPEQAKGRPADKRSDIWAFGAVLYETLSGRRAFGGEDVFDTLAAILRSDPRWVDLPSNTPWNVRRLLQRCLQKDPRRRLQHIGDARLELDEPDDGRVEIQLADGQRRRRIWPFVVTTAALAVITGFSGWMLASQTPRAQPQVRRYIITAREAKLGNTTLAGADLALSPDGRTLVYAVQPAGLLRRQADGLAFEPVRGAEGGATPFFSPDGSWIGFRSVSDGRLKKVPAEGGFAVTICDAPNPVRATWGDDGSILIATGGDLYTVSANGGKPELIVKADNDGYFAQPYVLPGSKVVLVRRGPPLLGHIEAIELSTRTHHRLVEGATPQLAATGDLVFEQNGSIWAIKFDAQRLSVAGAPVPVVESVRVAAGYAQFSTSGDGSLAYIAGNTDLYRSLVWLDRTGKATDALQTKGAFQSPRLSPDGKRVVVSSVDGPNLDLWAYEFERGTRLRLTTTGNSRRTAWSPDGLQVTFYSTGSRAAPGDRGGPSSDQDLFTVPSMGGDPKKLLTRPGAQFPDAWSPDGRFLVFEEGEAAAGAARRDLWVLPIGEAPRPLLVTRFYERGAVFSPDGRWLAFVTDESGRAEVYVQPFPGPGPKVAISNNGGLQPMWARDGHELFYREGDSMMAVRIALDPFRIEAPRRLFEFSATTFNLDPNFADYDVAPDGRFLAVQGDTAAADDINVVLNWTEELKRLVPSK
jgi:Tol biopolymer transport system component